MSILDLFKKKTIPTGHRERLAAIKAITEQKKLVEIAQTDPDGFVRIAAAEKIYDTRLSQSLLETLVGHDHLDTVRYMAAKKLHDSHLAQLTYTSIAVQGRVCWLRLAAAKQITNKTLAQSLLKAISENKGYYYKAVRQSAAKMLRCKDDEPILPGASSAGAQAYTQAKVCPSHNVSMAVDDGDFDFHVDHSYCQDCSNRPTA